MSECTNRFAKGIAPYNENAASLLLGTQYESVCSCEWQCALSRIPTRLISYADEQACAFGQVTLIRMEPSYPIHKATNLWLPTYRVMRASLRASALPTALDA